MSTAVETRDLVKTFRDSGGDAVQVLRGVSVQAAAGSITSILGESGCGKTTLLRIIAGLESATSGSVCAGDRDITAVHPSRRQVAMVFQNYGLYPAKTVAGNIEFPLKMAGVPRAERRARALAAAEVLHIEHLMDRLPAQLSGGQRQRVGICRAIAREPEIVLMDEPLSSLDAQLRIEMRSELVALQRRIGSTMITVTHDQTEAMTMSDSIVVMRGGQVEQVGSPMQIFDRPQTAYVASFLGNMNLAHYSANSGVEVSSLPTQSGATTLGVRPEQFMLAEHVVPETDDLRISGRVVRDELLGTDRVLHVAAGDAVWRARVPATVPFGERCTLVARRAHVHEFELEGGVRIDR